MPSLEVDTAFIVGAGFSHHAGLPLTSKFTEAILEAREFKGGPSKILVEFLSRFIHDAFDHSRKAKAKHWPDLEDIFTCVDLSANFGHHLGTSFAPADLRTVRRAMLSRIVRMLDHKYQMARKRKSETAWRQLDDFFYRISSQSVGFISMNWDTVIERKLALTRGNPLLDYCCDAWPANIPDPPDDDLFSSNSKYEKEIEKGQIITIGAMPPDRRKVDASTPIIKIHGSTNWLYCDSCQQLFWFHPDQSRRIADQIIRVDDLSRIREFFLRKSDYVEKTIENLRLHPQVKCAFCEDVALGTRIATFSYRKALDFPMFQKSWFAAEELLRRARKWVFIGYSLPAADYEFKHLLKRIQLSRRKQPQFIIISGGKKNDVGLAFHNYRRFFGRTVNKSSFFPSGITHDAIEAVSR